MNAVQAAIRLFMLIMTLGIAVNVGGLFWWVIVLVNLLLFASWMYLAMQDEQKLERK